MRNATYILYLVTWAKVNFATEVDCLRGRIDDVETIWESEFFLVVVVMSGFPSVIIRSETAVEEYRYTNTEEKK